MNGNPDENFGLWLIGDDDKVFNIFSYRHFTFKTIRGYFDIDEDEFSSAWLSDEEYSQSKSGGKSGSNFIFSKDKKYIIKTILKSEKDTVLNFLKDLTVHYNEDSDCLITRILFMGKFIANGMKKYFFVMNNLFHDKTISTIYDLKGSTINRKSSKKKLNDPKAIRLDLDLDRTFQVGKKMEKKIINQIVKDTNFLLRHGLMDYSLLVGIVNKSSRKRRFVGFSSWDKGVSCKENHEEFFFIGIIDITQFYSFKKKVIHFFKSILMKSKNLSTVNPEFYAERFQNFMRNIFE